MNPLNNKYVDRCNEFLYLMDAYHNLGSHLKKKIKNKHYPKYNAHRF